MKRFYLLLLIFAFSLCNAIAQTGQRPGEVFIQQANFEHNDAAKQFTSDFISLFDMSLDAINGFDSKSNTAILNLMGTSNSSNVSQSGWGNVALVNILGDRNTTGFKQNGTGNTFILNLEGSDNIVDGMQTGKDNNLRMDLIGGSHNQSFMQTGNNLSLQLFDNGNGGGVPMQIEQRGNGGSVIIENY